MDWEPSPGDIIRKYHISPDTRERIVIAQWIVLNRQMVATAILPGTMFYYCYLLGFEPDEYHKEKIIGEIVGLGSYLFNYRLWEIVVESGLSWDDEYSNRE